MATSAEALYVEGMQSSMVELDGDAEKLIHVALDTYDFLDVIFLPVAPVGRERLPYSFKWMMLNQAHRVFTYEDF